MSVCRRQHKNILSFFEFLYENAYRGYTHHTTGGTTMKKLTLSGLFVSFSAAALLLGGCAGSYQARSVDLKRTWSS